MPAERSDRTDGDADEDEQAGASPRNETEVRRFPLTRIDGDDALPAEERRVGEILVQAGRLTSENSALILEDQRARGLRFGDAGRELGLLSQADIEFALARQFDYPYLQPGEGHIADEVIAAFDPSCRQVESLRGLRSELMMRWFDGQPAHKAVVVASAAPQEGRSFITANLAVVFAQLGQRTLLIDGDLRNPRQHRLFGIDNRLGLSTILAGRAGLEAVQHIVPLGKLSVLPSGVLPPNPQELLARPILLRLLDELAVHFDAILFDSSSAASGADAKTLAARAGAAIVLAHRNGSRYGELQNLLGSLKHAGAAIVGTVLNDWRREG